MSHDQHGSIVAAGTAVLTAILATTAGYGFGRFSFRGRGLMFAVTLLALMVPYQAILTPAFLELNFLHLTNSLLGLILFYSTFNRDDSLRGALPGTPALLRARFDERGGQRMNRPG